MINEFKDLLCKYCTDKNCLETNECEKISEADKIFKEDIKNIDSNSYWVLGSILIERDKVLKIIKGN